ncbi:phosphate/sulfate permease [Streptomyces sp. HB372]|nr:phosphate/sulfate permease [Streptomyces sp. HB372]
MEHITLLLAIVVVTALVFDFTNGFHDTANAMATTISTGALKPKTAVAMSAVLNLIGAFLSVEVAKTISGGIVNEDGLRTEVIFAALVGAILWNLLTWLVGLPSSSSHALFGGLIGAAVMSAGWSSINGGTVVTKVLLPAIAAPLVAGLAAMLATRLTYRINRNVTDEGQLKSTAKGYRAGQIASAGLVSLAHGTNDAQKTMGIITLALVTGGVLAPGSNPPLWVIVSAGVAIALGTYLGGWRIIRTMGKGLTDLQPPQGFAAQTSAATVILASSHLGFSLSTTQSCSGGRDGRGPRPQGRCGPLVHRHPDVHRLGPDAPGRGPGRRGRRVPHEAGPLGHRRHGGHPGGRFVRDLGGLAPPAGRPHQRQRHGRRRAPGRRHHRHGRGPAAARRRPGLRPLDHHPGPGLVARRPGPAAGQGVRKDPHEN